MPRRSLTDHERSQQQRRSRWTREEQVERGLKAAARAIERGETDDYQRAVRLLDDRVKPALSELTNAELPAYGRQLGADERWDQDAIEALLESPDALTKALKGNASGDGVVTSASGFSDPRSAARDVIETAHQSLEAIAEYDDIVQDAYDRRVPAEGHALRLGDHLQDGEMDLGESVTAVSLQAGTLKTLFCGETGFGKSTGLEREGEDFYQAGQQEGRDYKLIDVVDLDTGENWVYDIPQQQSELRRIREEEFDLPPDFAADDDLATPEIDIRVPLSPGLSSEQLPFDTDREEFSVTPFTIPASDLRKPILIPCIMSRLSDDQEQTVRQAYDDVNREKDDWSLKDLADAIRNRDELQPKHKADAIGVLRSLQGLGFIRTRNSGHTINWRELFTDTDSVTVFSQALIPDGDRIGKMLCVAYLIDKILQLRRRWSGLPEAALLMRELWEIVPHNRRNSSDERAAAIQDAIATQMARVFRKNRHFGLHLLGDTQEPGDLHIATREMFNRYVVYSATEKTVDKIFSWTMNDRDRAFLSTLTAKRGQAGVVGQVQPAIDNRRIEFLSPLEYAPPSHHHFSVKTDDTGWKARADYLSPLETCPECEHEKIERHDDDATVYCPECDQENRDPSLGREEVLRRPVDVDGVDWPDSIPARLEIEAEDADQAPSIGMRPVAAFAHECLSVTDDSQWLYKSDVRAVFNEFLKKHDRETWDFSQRGKQTAFGKRISDYYDDDEIGSAQRNRETVFTGMQLTPAGQELYEKASGPEHESSAEPIRADD